MIQYANVKRDTGNATNISIMSSSGNIWQFTSQITDTISGFITLSTSKSQDTIKIYSQYSKVNIQPYTDTTAGVDTIWAYVQNPRNNVFPVGVWNTNLRTYADYIVPSKSVYRDFGIDYWNPYWIILRSNGKSTLKLPWRAIK